MSGAGQERAAGPASEEHDLPIRGRSVLFCMVDYGFTLHFEDDVEIRIEKSFTLRTAGGVHELDPEAAPEGLGPALVLSRATAASGSARADGRLRLDFVGGAVLEVSGGDQHEAWTLVGRGGYRLVSEPGGGLVIWSPEDDLP